jgi:hypothetical protein
MAKKSALKKSVVVVTPRRLARDFGPGKKGTIALILDAKKFGAGPENWLLGKTFASKELALAAAKAAGAEVIA